MLASLMGQSRAQVNNENASHHTLFTDACAIFELVGAIAELQRVFSRPRCGARCLVWCGGYGRRGRDRQHVRRRRVGGLRGGARCAVVARGLGRWRSNWLGSRGGIVARGFGREGSWRGWGVGWGGRG